MKSFIDYYYNICPDKIYSTNNEYFFFTKNNKIYIKKYSASIKTLESIFDISNNLYSMGIPVSTFLLNKEKGFYTKKKQDNIVLLKVNDVESNQITLKDIYDMNVIVPNNLLNSMDTLSIWKNIIDTLEEEMIEYNKEYQIIQNSINYYIGISENAITLLTESNYLKNEKECLCHNIEFDKYSLSELNNPLNFTISNPMHDVSQYIKYKFFNNVLDYDELETIILNRIYDEYDIRFLYASLLFSDYYFVMVRKILLGETEEKEINKYINSIKNYEKFLIECKELINKRYNLPNISWLKENY